MKKYFAVLVACVVLMCLNVEAQGEPKVTIYGAASGIPNSVVAEIVAENPDARRSGRKLQENEQKSFDVPNGWEGMYYPTYIPDGFEVINVENLSEQIFLISFENKNNEYLTFEEMTEDAESNIDTENAQVYYTEIHGNTALVSVKADLTIVSWNEQNRILSVVFDGEVEEDALKVAKSVTRIK